MRLRKPSLAQLAAQAEADLAAARTPVPQNDPPAPREEELPTIQYSAAGADGHHAPIDPNAPKPYTDPSTGERISAAQARDRLDNAEKKLAKAESRRAKKAWGDYHDALWGLLNRPYTNDGGAIDAPQGITPCRHPDCDADVGPDGRFERAGYCTPHFIGATTGVRVEMPPREVQAPVPMWD